MWRRGTTSTCSGAAGLMSLKATVVGRLVHDLGGHLARHDLAEEAVASCPWVGIPSAAALIIGTNLPAPGSSS